MKIILEGKKINKSNTTIAIGGSLEELTLLLQNVLAYTIPSTVQIGTGETVALYPEKVGKVYLHCTDLASPLKNQKEAIRTIIFQHLVKEKGATINIIASHWTKSLLDVTVMAAVLAEYAPTLMKSSHTLESNEPTTIIYESGFEDKEIYESKAIGEAQIAMMHLTDSPANVKTPEYMAEQCRKLAKTANIKVDVMDEVALMEGGYGAIVAVGQGSEHPPRLVSMEYAPKAYKKTILLVGKGVTFDTGGISIKASTNMHYMKCDMGGGAVVYGVMHALSKMDLPVRVIGIIPIAENAVDQKSIKPGDVIYSYSGKSIEIMDTDAEGRLILADALYHGITTYKPDHVIDLATLTGSIVRTLGGEAAGLFSNDNVLTETIKASGELVGERVWPMPMYKEYESHLHSDIADVSNLSASPVAGAIAAAKFLEVFIDGHTSWAHIDIAGVAFDMTPYGKAKAATGYGLALIIESLKRLS